MPHFLFQSNDGNVYFICCNYVDVRIKLFTFLTFFYLSNTSLVFPFKTTWTRRFRVVSTGTHVVCLYESSVLCNYYFTSLSVSWATCHVHLRYVLVTFLSSFVKKKFLWLIYFRFSPGIKLEALIFKTSRLKTTISSGFTSSYI